MAETHFLGHFNRAYPRRAARSIADAPAHVAEAIQYRPFEADLLAIDPIQDFLPVDAIAVVGTAAKLIQTERSHGHDQV
jgi:hypothetical protein